MNYDTIFKKKLIRDLSFTKLKESSINNYVRHMEILNDDLPLKNLDFLKDSDDIIKKLEKYKENTKRNYLISICAILGLFRDKKNYKDIYMKYFSLLADKNKILKAQEHENEKSITQNENWINWEDVIEKWEELKNKVNKWINNKDLNEFQYNTFLDFLILSLYVLIPVRRNKDFLDMNIIKGMKAPNLENNYLFYDEKEFQFNVYKTVKSHGQQDIKIPDNLMKIIDVYLKIRKLDKVKKFNVPLLVNYENEPIKTINSITYVLNRIFKKKISSSMLRHSFLTFKFGDTLTERKEIAKQMGHSTGQADDYIKLK